MLFILAMDMLGFLITKAENEGVLRPLAPRTLQHRVSYADDVMLFLQPVAEDINLVLDILHCLGKLQAFATTFRRATFIQ
jgi:hypothetical protein